MSCNKPSNFIGFFGILLISLGVAIACSTTSTTDDISKKNVDNGQIISGVGGIEQLLLNQFKTNFMGTYTAEETVQLDFYGKSMIFNNNGIVTTSTSEDDPISIDLMVNDSPGSSTITHIFFKEGGEDYYPNIQSVIAITSTNILIGNLVMYTTGKTVEGGDIIELIINPETGVLTFDGVKIATKNR